MNGINVSNEEVADIYKALGHVDRLTMVLALNEGPMCVCELKAEIGSSMPTISRHLGILREKNIIKAYKKGNKQYYYISMKCILDHISCIKKRVNDDKLKSLGKPYEK